MALPYLKNLSSTVVNFSNPWEFVPSGPIPEEIRKKKSFRDKWINDPETEWNCFSCWEGLTAGQRISVPGVNKDGTDREENPPQLCHGFVVDYDTPLEDEEILSGFTRMSPFQPNYYCRSLSGNCHLVFLFDKPVRIGSFALAKEFLKVVAEKTRVSSALPSFDDAFFIPGKYYTNGADWKDVNPVRISNAVGLGWVIEASKKINYAEKGYNVPLDIVKTELLKNPKFAQLWDGIEFVLGAQGPTWWVEESQSPKSAIVKESGMFTFSSHAVKEFYTWGELIGFSFVDQYRANFIGNAVEGIYFDGRQFWREINRGDWKAFSKDDILHFLRVTRGLSDKVAKGDKGSELDLAYEFLIDHHNIEGAAPFVFKPNGLMTVNSKPFLNIHTARVLRPVDQKTEWGHPDHFPFLSQFFGAPSTVSKDDSLPRFFKGGHVALDTFISWLAHFYRTGHELNLSSGLNIFIAGPVGVGKTLVNRAIIGGVMNGYREAKEYLMGEDSFGAELFSVAHWVVDDGTMSTSLTAHRLWGEMIKRMAANKTFRYHEKFRTPLQVDWQGRVVSTLNNDEESARLLPDLQRSLLDKIGLWATTDKATVSFPSEAELRAILDRELPYFARFLLEWQTPTHCLLRRPDGSVDYRFGGVRPWHDPTLVQHANQSSRTAGFVEILEDWKEDYFKTANETRKGERVISWTGSAFQLRKIMCANPATQDALRGTDNGDIGRLLAQLKTKGYPIEAEDKGDIRVWTIFENARPPAPQAVTPSTPEPKNSKFQKAS